MSETPRSIGDWIDAFMVYTEDTEPPAIFRRWTAISVVAAALQRKCYLEWGHLVWYPNMYIVLVGPSSSRKGTAMGPGYDLLQELNVPMAAQATSLQALIRRMKESSTSTPNPENPEELHLHSSLTIFSKEFTVFLGYQNNELMAHLCDWYDCERNWRYETISRQVEEVKGVWVNLLAATTPELIRSSLPLEAIGGGLTSRTVLVYAANKGKIVPVMFQSEEEKELRKYLLYDLEIINTLTGRFKVTQEFVDMWAAWYTESEKHPPAIAQDQRFQSYLGRRPTHVMKLSMILSASRSNSMVMDTQDLERAITYIEEAEVSMPYVFSGLGRNTAAEIMPKIMAYIGNKREVAYVDLMRTFWQDAGADEMDKILTTLEAAGYISVTLMKKNKIIRYLEG